MRLDQEECIPLGDGTSALVAVTVALRFWLRMMTVRARTASAGCVRVSRSKPRAIAGSCCTHAWSVAYLNLFPLAAQSARMRLDQEECIPLGDGTSAFAAVTVALRCWLRMMTVRARTAGLSRQVQSHVSRTGLCQKA